MGMRAIMHPKITKVAARQFNRLTALWRQRFGVLSLRKSIPDMRLWLQSPLGRALVDDEQLKIKGAIQDLFGYHFLQLGLDAKLDFWSGSRIPHKFKLHPLASSGVEAMADFHHLPLANGSIDTVLVHHLLDYSQQPHQLLRELSRVIIPRGHLVIVGFNPWSLWGLGGLLSRLFSARAFGRQQYLRQGRLLDWLKLLDMEPVHVSQGFYRPPLAPQRLLKYLQWMEAWGKKLRLPCGGYYLIVARKDHLALTPIKPAWKGYRPVRAFVVTRIVGRVVPLDGYRSTLGVSSQIS
jgi:SAM-dependent methyltransferase